MKRLTLVAVGSVAMVGIHVNTASADAVADFYHGRTLTILTGFTGASTYGVYSRVMGKYLTKYVPGNPQVIPQFMPGAGSVKAINFLYNAAPQDGSYMGIGIPGLAVNQLILKKGIRYDMRKFKYIGRLVDGNVVYMIRSDVPGGATIQNLQKQEIVVGGSGKGTHTYIFPTIMNALLGTKFKVVLGYKGARQEHLAMEQNEIQGMTGSWLTWKNEKPHWLANKFMTPLVEIGLEKAPGDPNSPPDLPGVPLLKDLGKTQADKDLLAFLSSPTLVGRAVLVPPGVPGDRVNALRQAFDKTMSDPGYIAEMKQVKLPIRPASGAVIQAAVDKALASPRDLVKRASKLLRFE